MSWILKATAALSNQQDAAILMPTLSSSNQVATGPPLDGNVVIQKAIFSKWQARRNADAVSSWWKHIHHGQCRKQCT
jgi:hypothetical protein